MRQRWSFYLAIIAAASTCKPATDPTVTAPLADALSVRLSEVSTGADYTFHIPLTIGHTVRLRVRLYVADGREITPLQNPLQMTFTFAPASLATSATADSVTLLQDVTPTDTAGAVGHVTVTLTEPATGTTKAFGPFEVLVH